MDQGEELWRSNELRDVAFAAGYYFEPTGFDAASENGKVKRANGTFGAMMSALQCWPTSMFLVFCIGSRCLS
jgi:hypothetical protein